MPGRVVLLDLDDCVAGAIWPFSSRPRKPVDRAIIGALLQEIERSGLCVHLLTNRPPGQLPVIGHIMGGPARYHLAESGLSAWLPDENRAIVHPQFVEFAEHVRPRVIERLRAHLQISPDGPIVEEFGTRLVSLTVFPLHGDVGQIQQLCERIRRLLDDLPVEVRVGKGVDIAPAGTDKVVGCKWAEVLHPDLQGAQLNWHEVLYIEDSTTGLRAAKYILERGGMVAAVANAAPELKEIVNQRGGIICDNAGEAGVLEAIRRWLA